MRPIHLACALAVLATPSYAFAQQPVVMTAACGAPQPDPAGKPYDLVGQWDFMMDVAGRPSFGVLAVGWLDGGYGGSLTPMSTAPVVIRTLTLTGHTFKMTVASREGDVVFEGALSGRGDRMCGIVAYHGGQRLKMVTHRRPSTYAPPAAAAASPPGTSAAPSRGTSAPDGR